MLRFLCKAGLMAAVILGANRAPAFSLLGPYDEWQTPDIGYQLVYINEDIGGPMNLTEEYRWNVKTIYYGFDPSFDWFGPEGVKEVKKAIAIINGLPPFSKMSQNLTEFPTDTTRVNFRASALGIVDLKSATLGLLVEELGLTSPERFVWTLRDKVAIPGGFSYQVIKRNFDPAPTTWPFDTRRFFPSSYVNGTLYSYVVLDPVPGSDPEFADAVEISVDPFAVGATAVASVAGGQLLSTLGPGQFFTGLTRDDVGGLRYIYHPQNWNIENLVPTVTTNVAGAGGPPWTPVGGGPVVDAAVRPGINKIILKEAKYDSRVGFFIQFTNTFTDRYVTNSRVISQRISRAVITPDIIFSAADLNRSLGTRTSTEGWANNAGTNTTGGGVVLITGGPGVIQPPVFITFNRVGPYIINQYSGNAFFLDEATGSQGLVWGSFDGSTNAPIIYPSGVSIDELERRALTAP